MRWPLLAVFVGCHAPPSGVASAPATEPLVPSSSPEPPSSASTPEDSPKTNDTGGPRYEDLGAAMFRANASRTGEYAAPGPELGSVRWHVPVSSGEIASSPAVLDGIAYVGGPDGVYALDVATGKVRWSTSLGAFVHASPAVAGDRVVVGVNAPHLYALDVLTGEVVWQFDTEALVTSSPAIAEGQVFFGSYDGLFRALELTTGDLLWSIDAQSAITTSPAVDEGNVYFASDGEGATLYAADAETGSILWTRSTGNAGKAIAAWNGALFLTADYFPQSWALSLDASTGEERWVVSGFETSFKGAPAVSEGIVVLPMDEHGVLGLDAGTGDLRWEADVPSTWSSPAIASGTVYVTPMDGVLYALSLQTGVTRWSVPIGGVGNLWPSPAVDGGLVVTGSQLSGYWGIE